MGLKENSSCLWKSWPHSRRMDAWFSGHFLSQEQIMESNSTGNK